MVLEQIAVALIVTSVFSGLGAFSLFMTKDDFDRLVPLLISLAAGTIFGGVFIHLIFRLSAGTGYSRLSGILIIAGMIGSFFLEKLVHWHCHDSEHREPLPYILAAGDAVHNILDGILIATSFLVSVSAGTAATIAVIAHKIPKELGDFGIMVEGGFSKLKALGVNIGVTLFMFLGAGLVIGAFQTQEKVINFLLPLVIGNFVFIAGSDLLPELKKQEPWVSHIMVFLVGVAIMYAIPYLKSLI